MAAIRGPAARVFLGSIFAICRLTQNTRSFTNHSLPTETIDQSSGEAQELPRNRSPGFSPLCGLGDLLQKPHPNPLAVCRQGFWQDVSAGGTCCPLVGSPADGTLLPGHSPERGRHRRELRPQPRYSSCTQTTTASLSQPPKSPKISLNEPLPDIPGKSRPERCLREG